MTRHPLLKDYGADISWSIGSLFCHEDVLVRLLTLLNEYNVPNPVKWAFGMPSALMAGGRLPVLEMDVHEGVRYLASHLEDGIACRLTLSNPYVDALMTREDRLSMELLSFLNSHSIDRARNGVILVSDYLANLVRDRFPNLEVILSVIRPAYEVGYGSDTLEWYSEKLANPLYDVVVVNNARVLEAGFAEALPSKERVELLACHDCISDCRMARMHYDLVADYGMRYCRMQDCSEQDRALKELKMRCRERCKKNPWATGSLSADEIRHLASLGFRQFKISGRTATDERFEWDLKAYLFRHEQIRFLDNAE